MVESIRELRRICQSSKKEKESWYVRFVLRKISIYFSWLFLHTPLTPNQITFSQTVLGIMGAIFLSSNCLSFLLTGAILLQLSSIFDCVDGEVARFKKLITANGLFIDGFNHLVVSALIYLSVGVHCFRLTNNIFYLYCAALLAVFSLLPVSITLRSALMTIIERKNISELVDFKEYFPAKDITSLKTHSRKSIYLKKIIDFGVGKTQIFLLPPYNMILFPVLLVFNVIFKYKLNVLIFVIMAIYAGIYILLNFFFLWYWVKNKEIASLYHKINQSIKPF